MVRYTPRALILILTGNFHAIQSPMHGNDLTAQELEVKLTVCRVKIWT
jgi:hypothetical protein